ncbi:NfeD family protein [Pontibacillus marinus]|uniref:Membrane protein n=1 Tax=Pontibacillus marinus BH030004 = DSM 16465 TaxID=1385511 RepID=A0A0A5FXG7_9BACI|nr:nodulation protein NfeD [Pontibacillus marinus]KGX83508.1 membrane protein [Pontibacillus marinus BH030004 = DSM 16465]
MKKIARLIWILSIVCLIFPMFFSGHSAAEGEGKKVFIVPLENAVERGLEAFLERSANEARKQGADHIIFEIDTPGGSVEAAKNIAQIFQAIEIPTTAYIKKDALSAGSYISMNADQIYMDPNATMGAAGVITSDGNAADKKAQSAWITAMRSAAKSNDRDPKYAEAMANKEIDLPELRAGKGKFLTLGAEEAMQVGYAEGIVDSRNQLLERLDLSDAETIETQATLTENIARFITSPVVVPILLSIASLGFVVELYSPGFGIPGIMGFSALILFFYGHMVADLAGYEVIILFLIGVVCVVLEIFVPGGILGVIGVGAIIGSLFLSTDDMGHMTMSIAIALMVAIIASVLLFRFMGLERGFFRNIILSDSTSTEKGYISSKSRLELIGLEGTTLTPLRPSGTGIFEGERIDVVSEGGYISNGAQVKIVKAEGTRVVVRELDKEE